MDNKQQPDDLGQPGEIKQYDRQVAPEEATATGRKDEGTPIYLASDSTLQTPDEHQHDQSVDPRKDDGMSASNDDLHDPIANLREQGDTAEES